MPSQLSNIRIDVSDKIYLKDPYSSDLGRQIIKASLPLIDELGMEKFTFKKLAARINTTESAVYRYFENKHKLLLFYVSWYWGWLEYNLAFGTANIESPKSRLDLGIKIITSNFRQFPSAPFDMSSLHHVIISESSKAYLTKEIDIENKAGLFKQYKSLACRLTNMIEAYAPGFPYSKTLISILLESHIGQMFFIEHLPSMSDLDKSESSRYTFYSHLIFSSIAKWKK